VKVTPERKAAFCAALAEAGGNVSRACEAVDVTRMTAYRWRTEDEAFARAWDEAKAIGLDALEDEATRRAFEGCDKPVFHQGVKCGTIREYSDTLAIFLLKGGKPEKYRENSKVELHGSLDLRRMSDEELDAEIASLATRLAAAKPGDAGNGSES
jgi:transposase-like protein